MALIPKEKGDADWSQRDRQKTRHKGLFLRLEWYGFCSAQLTGPIHSNSRLFQNILTALRSRTPTHSYSHVYHTYNVWGPS